MTNEIRRIETDGGTKFLMNLDTTQALWDVYKGGRPKYLSVKKTSGKWVFTVWGKSALEVRNNYSDLQQRQREASPATPPKFTRPGRPRHPEEEPGRNECDTDFHYDRGDDAENY